MPELTITETIAQATAPDAHIPIDLRRQYVSGGQGVWYGTAARSLPWAIDDVTLAFGDDLYDRMVLESVVAASVNIFKAGVLADGVSLTSAVSKKGDDGYDEAAAYVSWCEDLLADLDVSLLDVLFNLLDAIAYGNKVAELVYAPDSTYTGKEQIILRGIHVKPRRAVAMVVDPFKTLLGVLALIPGENVWPLTGIQIKDIGAMPNFVPLEKFAVLTFRPQDHDPRGTSILRAAYDPWWRKQETKDEHRKYLARFASPSLAGFTPKNAQPVPRLGPDGTSVLDANGNPVYDYPNDVMRDALLAFQNGTVVVFPDGSPDGSRLQVVQVQGEGKAFLEAFSLHDREIIKAILTATLAVGEGEHASRAQAGVHQDAQETLIGHAKQGVVSMLRSVLRRFVGYNYGDDARRLAPKVSLGGTEQEDLAKVWTAVAALATSGYIDESQKAELDAEVNLPERSVAAADGDGTMPDDTTGQDANGQPAALPGQPAPAAPPAPPAAVAKPASGKAAMSVPARKNPMAGKRVTVSARTDPKDVARHVAMLNRWTKENQAALWPKDA